MRGKQKRPRRTSARTSAIFKQLLSMVLVVVMLMTSLPLGAFANQAEATGSNPFKDVKSSDWYYESVNYIYQNSIFNGTADDTFSPSDGMTRAMFVTTLGRFAGVDATEYSGNGGFTDVDPDAYYAPYVVWAAENGITKGIGDGLFDVNGLVTREQMAVFVARFMTVFGGTFSSASNNKAPPRDLDEVASWAVESVLTLWNANILNGDQNQNFNPKATATRAEAATFYMNLGKSTNAMGILKGDTDTDPEPTPTTTPDKPDSSGGGGSSSSGSGGSYYTVTLNTGGDPELTPLRVRRGSKVTDLPQPVRSGAVFVGWYKDTAYTQKFDESTPVNANLTLYAQYI